MVQYERAWIKRPQCAAFDGLPRMVALGSQVAKGEIANDDDRKPTSLKRLLEKLKGWFKKA